MPRTGWNNNETRPTNLLIAESGGEKGHASIGPCHLHVRLCGGVTSTRVLSWRPRLALLLILVLLLVAICCSGIFFGYGLRRTSCTRSALGDVARTGAQADIMRIKEEQVSQFVLPLAGFRALIVSHELSATGAPRACFELAQVMGAMGAEIRVSLQGHPGPEAEKEICSFAKSTMPSTMLKLRFGCSALSRQALSAPGIVLVSTAIVRNALFLRTFREVYDSDAVLVWWIHEGASVMAVLGDEAVNLALNVLADPQKLDAVLFVSESCRRFWVNAAAARGASIAAPTYILHWGVPEWKRESLDAALLDPRGPSALRASLGFGPNDFVFLMLSSFNLLKGHSGVAKAIVRANRQCPSLCRFRLLAAGMGLSWPGSFPQEELKWALSHSDLRFLPSTMDVATYLAASDAYVSNSKRGGETWGLATLEAATMGRVVLASGVGGTLEQLEHNVSALFHSIGLGDTDTEVDELAANMCAIATDANLATRISTGAQDVTRGRLGQAQLEMKLAELAGAFSRLGAQKRSSVMDAGRS